MENDEMVESSGRFVLVPRSEALCGFSFRNDASVVNCPEHQEVFDALHGATRGAEFGLRDLMETRHKPQVPVKTLLARDRAPKAGGQGYTDAVVDMVTGVFDLHWSLDPPKF